MSRFRLVKISKVYLVKNQDERNLKDHIFRFFLLYNWVEIVNNVCNLTRTSLLAGGWRMKISQVFKFQNNSRFRSLFSIFDDNKINAGF